jgi:radical SAM protein with 4Fe4S-binding SPASM domain
MLAKNKLLQPRRERFRRLLELNREKSNLQVVHPLRQIGMDCFQKGGWLQAPLVVMLDLTNACNQDCIFCYRSGPQGLAAGGRTSHQSLENIHKLCQDFARMGVASISLSGGEISCHPDFLAAAAIIKNHDLALTLVTNGTNWTEADVRQLQGLLEPERDLVELSLHAANAEASGRILQADHFSSLMTTLQLFKQYQIPFMTMTLILKDNQDQIDEILALAAAHGARERAVEAPFPKKQIPVNAYAALDDVLTIHERLITDRGHDANIAINLLHLSINLGFLGDLVDFYQNEGRPLFTCHAGYASCAVDFQGNMHLCQYLIEAGRTTIGNVFQTPFPTLWRRAKERRQGLDESSKDYRGACPAFTLESVAYPDGNGPVS